MFVSIVRRCLDDGPKSWICVATVPKSTPRRNESDSLTFKEGLARLGHVNMNFRSAPGYLRVEMAKKLVSVFVYVRARVDGAGQFSNVL